MANAPMSNPIYQRLNHDRKETRLLVVQAGTWFDKIQYSIHTVSLLDPTHPTYETISYVWGNAKERGTIYIDGALCDVPASSEEVLRRMRLSDKDRTLWIDAVCINQKDMAERGYQVGMMDLIYAQGSKNLIWLGGDEDGSTVGALEAIRAILLDARLETDDFATLGSTLFDFDKGQYRYGTKALTVDFDHEPLLQFFSRPWFRRLWVVQESVLAKESICHCGDHTIPLRHVLTTAIWLNYKTYFLGFRPNQGITNAMEIYNYVDAENGLYRPGSKAAPDMLTLLWELSYFLTSEPRDQVYALIGIFRNFQPAKSLPISLHHPQYSGSLGHVLRDATRFAEQDRKHLRFLRLVELSLEGSREPDLPTWVPRWGGLDRYMWTARPLDASADGRAVITPWHHRSRDPNILTADGFIIGRVEQIAPKIVQPQLRDTTGVLDTFLQANKLESSYTTPLKEDSISDTAAVALVSGVDWQDDRISRADAQSGANALVAYIKSHKSLPPPISDMGDKQESDTTLASRYLHTVRTVSNGRCLFTTSSSSIGLGPAGTKVGDSIAILLGCPWPVVLIRGESQGVTYSFVGCCFIDGVMDGEACRDQQAATTEHITFSIR